MSFAIPEPHTQTAAAGITECVDPATAGNSAVVSTELPHIRRVDHAILMRTGHHRQWDGSVVRVDIEMGCWVGSLYTPELELKTQVIGSDGEVHAWADRISM